MTSEFEAELDRRIADLQERLRAARAADEDYLVESLVDELQGLVEIAGDNEVDTAEMQRILAAETGAIPIVPEAQRGPSS
ncbi:hypothetical protein BRM1_04105 [Brevibacterium sp. BRM-1]|uniref:hypothetical protein n=1 Tax=Brevibacterium sp. BRM-1 TaxID=2999062 RepID=UPI002280534C|nr:hypothetical protein [Brevibacterium sp. BRM-1]WAL41056.1 hypothetical protein BRM1_04105 [Brevibacterium sp. BRM-1]